MQLDLISAGAAKGIVEGLAGRFRAEHDAAIAGTFGAVGAMKETLLAGAPCDAIILTQALLEGLAAEGQVHGDTIAPLGRVRTGIAVRSDDPLPAIDDAAALKVSLLAADAIFFPDPERATAGIHFMKVLDRLRIREDVGARLRAYPNGATAMAELSRSTARNAIGCTQVTEIRYTPGVTLVGVLPSEFELATVYAVALCTRAVNPTLAQDFIAMLTGPALRALREAGGFE